MVGQKLTTGTPQLGQTDIPYYHQLISQRFSCGSLRAGSPAHPQQRQFTIISIIHLCHRQRWLGVAIASLSAG